MVCRGVIQTLQLSKTKQGSPYVVVTFFNAFGKNTCSVWGATLDNFQKGLLFEASVKVSEDGYCSCTLKDVHLSTPTTVELSFLPHQTTKEEWDKVWQEIIEICPAARCQFLLDMKEFLYQKLKDGYAATQHHHTGQGGLLTHTYELLNMFAGLWGRFPVKVDPFIVAVASSWHDYGKLFDYSEDGSDYTEDFYLINHPVNSANACAAYLAEHNIDSRTSKFIFSAILSHHGKREWGAPIVPCNPEAFLVVMLDQLSGFGVQYDVPTGTKARETKIQRY